MLRTFVIGALVCLTAPAAFTQGIVGHWQGTLIGGGTELHVVLHIERGSDGGLSATLDSVDQGTNGIPVSSIVFEKARLTLRLDSINGAYEGTLSADGTEIDGIWSQGAPLTLNFKRKLPAPVPGTTDH